MHRHTISFTDFNGNPRTKELYFNLTEAELTKIQKDYLDQGGVQVVMNNAIQSGDTRKLLDFFELLVHRSYGIKSEDGMVFDKSPEIMRTFENSAFYSPLYMSFFEDEGKVGQTFITKVMPAELIAKAEANVRGEQADLHGLTPEQAASFKPSARQVFEQAQQAQQAQQAPAPQQPYPQAPAPQQPYQQAPAPAPAPQPYPQPVQPVDYAQQQGQLPVSTYRQPVDPNQQPPVG